MNESILETNEGLIVAALEVYAQFCLQQNYEPSGELATRALKLAIELRGQMPV